MSTIATGTARIWPSPQGAAGISLVGAIFVSDTPRYQVVLPGMGIPDYQTVLSSMLIWQVILGNISPFLMGRARIWPVARGMARITP